MVGISLRLSLEGRLLLFFVIFFCDHRRCFSSLCCCGHELQGVVHYLSISRLHM